MERANPERKPVDEARHILVVDDDRRIRELIKSYLMENGFLVSVAGTAAEARERMRGLTSDLLVLDIMMPGETDLALTTSLRSEPCLRPHAFGLAIKMTALQGSNRA